MSVTLQCGRTTNSWCIKFCFKLMESDNKTRATYDKWRGSIFMMRSISIFLSSSQCLLLAAVPPCAVQCSRLNTDCRSKVLCTAWHAWGSILVKMPCIHSAIVTYRALMFVAISLVKVCLEFIMACGLPKSGQWLALAVGWHGEAFPWFASADLFVSRRKGSCSLQCQCSFSWK